MVRSGKVRRPKPLMHDPEKSDSGIVAMKPMNKAGRLAAELAEPRPGTKGNADQQSTHRTQRRAVRYWDLAATEKTELNDPDWTIPA
jgi:phage terminase large subunit-like protein